MRRYFDEVFKCLREWDRAFVVSGLEFRRLMSSDGPLLLLILDKPSDFHRVKRTNKLNILREIHYLYRGLNLYREVFFITHHLLGCSVARFFGVRSTR
jgi:hypothetical protein